MNKRTLALCIIAAAISLALAFTGCGQPVVYTQPVVQPVVQQQVQPQYDIIQDPNTGVQYSVFYDNGIQQMVELSLFNSWMNTGGYTYVIHHYHDNPSYYRRYDSRVYSSYSRLPRNSPAYTPRFKSSTTPSVRSNSYTPSFKSTSTQSVRAQTPQFRSTTSSSSAQRATPTFKSSSSSSRSTSSFKSSSTRH